MSQLYGQNHLQEKSFSENVYTCLNIVSVVVNNNYPCIYKHTFLLKC